MTATATPAIRVRGLRRSYGEHEVVRGIDLEVARGEILALLGPNGAGKTTTVEVLEGFAPADAGTVEVLGVDPWTASTDWRDRVGIVLQDSAPEPGLTVAECLALYRGYHRHPRDVAETLAAVGLEAEAGARTTALSGGQRRRLDVALALIGDPELLFLDEPTTGFDPTARRSAWTMIDGLRKLGKTIVLTTHYMEEAERLADRIAVLRAGEIVAEGAPGALGHGSEERVRISFLASAPAVDRLPAALASRVERDPDGRLAFRTQDIATDLQALSTWALANGLDLADLELHRPNLEDVYLELTT